jgi:hypothetical protein
MRAQRSSPGNKRNGIPRLASSLAFRAHGDCSERHGPPLALGGNKEMGLGPRTGCRLPSTILWARPNSAKGLLNSDYRAFLLGPFRSAASTTGTLSFLFPHDLQGEGPRFLGFWPCHGSMGTGNKKEREMRPHPRRQARPPPVPNSPAFSRPSIVIIIFFLRNTTRMLVYTYVKPTL